jgi:hypothetical protein
MELRSETIVAKSRTCGKGDTANVEEPMARGREVGMAYRARVEVRQFHRLQCTAIKGRGSTCVGVQK